MSRGEKSERKKFNSFWVWVKQRGKKIQRVGTQVISQIFFFTIVMLIKFYFTKINFKLVL